MKPRYIIIKVKDLIFVVSVTIIAIITIIFALNFIADANSDVPGKLAIIIDDFGQARDGVDILMSIDRKMTCAVMPMLEHSEKDMKDAIAAGHEVIIHIPIQYSKNDNVKWVGANAIRTTHDDKHIVDQISKFMDNLPLAAGANIHMGSLGSADMRIMTTIMKTLNERGLYFIDSKTNNKSVCKLVAKDVGISFNENDVFLENKGKDKESIKKQLIHAAKISKKTGRAFAIGHVGAESKLTAQVIKDSVEEIESMGVQFVHVSEIIN